MKNKYRDWIEKNILDSADGLCLEWSGLMVQKFPELKLVEGDVCLLDGTKDGHFWCTDPDGNIIDPTACQYDNQIIKYVFEKYPVPTGKCKICGEKTYYGFPCCSAPCFSKKCKEDFEWWYENYKG